MHVFEMLLYIYRSSVLLAHNGFAFDFLFLMAEVKRRKLEEILGTVEMYYADTLHDARRVS